MQIFAASRQAIAGFVLGSVTIGTACARGSQQPQSSSNSVQKTASLKTLFAKDFMVGAAINSDQFEERDIKGAALIKEQFNTISPENVLKWEKVHPTRGTYDFAPADKYVAFGVNNKMFVIGHTLVWHSQVPRWVFQDDAGKPVSRDTLLGRMRDHIMTVVGRYKGRIKGWDVVNEALNEDGTLRKSQWFNIIGEDYLVKAFQYAHEADPNAELYYNDYSLENPAKRAGAVKLIKTLQAAGVKIHAIGSQAHMKMDWPSVGLEDSTITIFAAAGVKVNITELDIDVLPSTSRNRTADVSLRIQANKALNPWPDALPDSAQTALAKKYGEMFKVFRKHSADIERITFWGVSDGDSWLNGWPIPGRTSYPLPFDRQHRPKPAFDSIAATVRSPRI
ncbi:MAG: endo-1,4-beta-xylanase [Gemmatimonadaceae bacterium]